MDRIMWWQVFGSVAQILSAIGALTFGAASIFVAIAAKDLQIQQAHDSALGRTSQLLTKYFDNINSTGSQFRYGFYCIAHVDALAKQLPACRRVCAADPSLAVHCRGREASPRPPFDGRGMMGPPRVEGTTGQRWAAVAAQMKEAAN